MCNVRRAIAAALRGVLERFVLAPAQGARAVRRDVLIAPAGIARHVHHAAIDIRREAGS